jgi:hypothetical protein
MSAMTVAKVIRDIFGGIGFIFTALFMASVVTMFIIILPAVYLDSIGLNVSPTMNFLSPVLEFIINSIIPTSFVVGLMSLGVRALFCISIISREHDKRMSQECL